MVRSEIKILLVEDNRADSRLIEELLKEVELTTFMIDVTESLSDAKSIIKKKDFDVILLDLGLPESQGLETLNQLNKISRHTPIIVLTGFDDEKTGIDSIKNGAQDYLIKGQIEPKMLSRIIMYCIERGQIKTKLKVSEEKYRTLTEELTESNSMKELLLDVITHDLKNPAGVIKGFAEFGLENDPNSEILEAIEQSVDGLLNVIDNATILSKVVTGDEIDKEAIDIAQMIRIITKEFAAGLQYAEMTLDMKLKGELIVNANPIIGAVFRNYISNAIKYAKTGKKIIINSNKETGYVVVHVKDFGKTIAKKDRENLFVRNVQLGKTKGQGLGLAIVKRIAKAHNAEVGVKPNKPKGNNFYIKIPVS